MRYLKLSIRGLLVGYGNAWADRLVQEITKQLTNRNLRIRVHEIRAESPEVVRVVYSDMEEAHLKGVKIDLASVRSASDRIRTSSVDEIAFDVVMLAIAEPRPSGEYLPVDKDGISWLPLYRWLEGD